MASSSGDIDFDSNTNVKNTDKNLSEGDDDDLVKSGTLSFINYVEHDKTDSDFRNSWPPTSVSSDSTNTFSRATFQVIDTSVEQNGRLKYVMYSLLIIGTAGFDSLPAQLHRRYSDFSKLHSSLSKKFRHIMEVIPFPKKALSGNFRPELIAERSRGFERYLQLLCCFEDVRCSIAFADFLYGDDLKSAYKDVCNGRYEQALPLLQNAWLAQRKILGDANSLTVTSLAAIAACCNALELDVQAQDYTDVAIRCLEGDDRNPYLAPFLRLGVRLCWKLGKNKLDLEKTLKRLRDRGVNVDMAPSLLDLVVVDLGKYCSQLGLMS